MADRRDNVIVHPGWGGAGKGQPVQVEDLRATLGQLDELGYRLQDLSPRSSWPAQRWMIASTPFRMRLTGALRRLDDLAEMSPAGEQSARRWAIELNDACHEAERRLHVLDACLHMLQGVDASPAERAQEIEIFASSRSELLKTLREIRHLIVWRFPAVRGES